MSTAEIISAIRETPAMLAQVEAYLEEAVERAFEGEAVEDYLSRQIDNAAYMGVSPFEPIHQPHDAHCAVDFCRVAEAMSKHFGWYGYRP